MELKCTDCMVTFEAPYDKDCPFCGTDAFVVEITNQPKLSIPKKIAEELEELTGKTNWESTPYSVIEEKGKINTWAYLGYGKCSEQLYKFCRDNTRLMHAYLNPLTRPFVEVEDE